MDASFKLMSSMLTAWDQPHQITESILMQNIGTEPLDYETPQSTRNSQGTAHLKHKCGLLRVSLVYGNPAR